MIKPQTLKGFRDFLPQVAQKRQYVIDKLKTVFESFGFEPIETPTLEYEEILSGKYGDEGDKLMYRFEDNGKRRVAMRYDQTVPLARVVAQYQNELPIPFKRYQIQNVWRAENTQKGRYREFLQCDIDIVGVDSPLADVEIITTTLECYKKLGFKNITLLINDRTVFEGLPTEAIIIIDKLKKIGEDEVCKQLFEKAIVGNIDAGKNLLKYLTNHPGTPRIQEITNILRQLSIDEKIVKFSPTLARGLDYYTGLILEIESDDYPYGSLAGGGRYDNLIGMFAGRQIPAVGLAFGFDRTIEAMDALNLFPEDLTNSSTKALVTIFSEDLRQESLKIASKLRDKNINTEIYLGEIKEKNPLEKQLKYADQKQIPYVLIIGPEEMESNSITVKNLKSRTQEKTTIEDFVKRINS
jgi:histidyl-tRNA synthetase